MKKVYKISAILWCSVISSFLVASETPDFFAEITPRSRFDYLSDTYNVARIANFLYGGIGRNAFIEYASGAVSSWIFIGVKKRADGQIKNLFEEHMGIVRAFMKNERRKREFFKRWEVFLTEDDTNYLCEVMNQDRSVPVIPEGALKIQYVYPGLFEQDLFEEFDLDKVVYELNTRNIGIETEEDFQPTREDDIDSALYFQYKIKGCSKKLENGEYNVFYLMKDDVVLVCPMNEARLLQGTITKCRFEKIEILPGNIWNVK